MNTDKKLEVATKLIKKILEDKMIDDTFGEDAICWKVDAQLLLGLPVDIQDMNVWLKQFQRNEESCKKLSASKLGEKNPQAILNEQKVSEIRVLLAEGILSNKEIADHYGVAPRTIRDIKNGITWKVNKIT
jgi:hypothetical protein